MSDVDVEVQKDAARRRWSRGTFLRELMSVEIEERYLRKCSESVVCWILDDE